MAVADSTWALPSLYFYIFFSIFASLQMFAHPGVTLQKQMEKKHSALKKIIIIIK